MNEPCLVFLSVGKMAEILKHLQETIEHAGNKDIGYLVKHPIIRLERR